MELPIFLSDSSRVPIYHQIEEQIKAMIASGQLPAGAALPSIRALSKDLKISVITTRRAYQNLEFQGFIKTTQGKGTFVAEIADQMKQEIKISTVDHAFEQAIETALRHDYSIEQIEEIFRQTLSKYNGKE